MSALHVTLLPADQSSRTVLPPTDPSSGIITFTARPTRYAWAVSQDLLAALGVNLDLHGSGRRHAEDLSVAHAWLVAHHVHTVVVRHADHLPHDTVLDDLRQLTAAVPARLVLTCDDTGGQRLIDYARDRGHDLLPLADLHRLLAEQARPVTPTASLADAGAFPVHLPKTDFPLFLHTCQQVLRGDDLAAVTGLYWDTFTAVRAAAPTDKDAAGRLLHDLVATRSQPGEVTVIVRAAQAAMFTQGRHLKVAMQALLVTVTDATHRRLTPTEIRSLRAYRQPWRAVVAALTDANLSQNDLQALTVGDVTEDGHLTGDHDPVHVEATVYLRAQRALRLRDGATATDPLIPVDGRSIVYALRRIGVDLNLPALGNHVRAWESRRERWASSVGITVQSLTGPINLKKAAA